MLKAAPPPRVVASADPAFVILDFTAAWCAPCAGMKVVLEELQKQHPEVIVQAIDVDEHSDVADRYKVQSMPTLVLVRREGIVVVGSMPTEPAIGESLVGGASANRILKWREAQMTGRGTRT